MNATLWEAEVTKTDNFQIIAKRGEGHSNSKNYITQFFCTKGMGGQGLFGIFLEMRPFLMNPGFPNRRHQLAITVVELTKSIVELLKLP